mmetsp:Transcript_15049/g.23122  ORF Transcript_15049/g.23122 Transcript_15049/m.23122 type:complete len:496 (+) Transcript_15049:186-1673(+)|eukprot:CAMPEP_0194216794 /NCGR_PEP_ID=MMETSP0156-20130528/19678_1 /TAXON_ID=33649 /ORGANISM="Thalassionema nitzschioides, Strain L26-B" /LENGTH=495 /DNA_ID=CAMNT_0038945641 /DNA_START=113 /DNA_END=1600 /DNA_ORIENTATION=+
MSSSYKELRSTLHQLEEYELSENLKSSFCSSSSAVNYSQTDKKIALRYQAARDEYLRRRTCQAFYEHLAHFDGASVGMPKAPTAEEQNQLKGMQEDARESLEKTIASVNQKCQLLQTKYDTFLHRRDVVGKTLLELEKSEFSTLDGLDDLDKENKNNQAIEDFVNEDDLSAVEEECAGLVRRRSELEIELSQLRHNSELKKKRLKETTSKLDIIRRSKDAPTQLVTEGNIEKFKVETGQIRKKVEKFKEMSAWYECLRSVMEELTGVKLLSVTNGQTPNNILLKLQLLGLHEVEIILVQQQRGQKCSNLRVQNARFLTSASVFSAASKEHKTLQLSIPELDDLVRVCSSMAPAEDLRFLIRETTSRISAVTARVTELTLLRSKFVAKIGKIQASKKSFGGEDQEVVCSINKGITVVLRLTPDCPNVAGSVYIDQIVGVGGWEQNILYDIKDNLNRMRFRSPIELMNTLESETYRLENEDGVTLPRTPSIPRRKRN